jgi:hypothetical protein
MDLLHPDHLRALLAAMASQDTVFILGAGASAPEMPTMKALVPEVVELLRKQVHGFFPSERTPLHERFLPVDEDGNPKDLKDDSGFYAHCVTAESIKLAIHECLDPHRRVTTPLPQYEVFDLVGANATILNYNTDGLAKSGPNRRLYWMHGTVIPGYSEWLATRELNAWWDAQYGIQVAPDSLQYPGPEPPEYLVVHRLNRVRQRLREAAAVVIIGYSFGLGATGLDDQQSYTMVCDELRERDVPVLVVDPGGDAIAGRLAEDLRNLRVLHIAARWDLLTRAILRAAREKGAGDLTSLDIAAILNEYAKLIG